MWKQSVFNAFFDSNYARPFLPDIIVFTKRIRVFVLPNQSFLFISSQVNDHLFWLGDSTPLSWLKISLNQMIWKLENFLILLFFAITEVLAKFFDPVSNITLAPPARMFMQSQLKKVFALVNMLDKKLAKMDRIPVSHLQEMSVLTLTKPRAVFI